METKIIKVVFGGRKYTTTAKRTRTDYGQMFEFVDITLPETFEVIFSNSNTSAGVGKKVIGSAQRVLIPDEYLATGQTIYAWILLHDTEDDGRHMYSIKSPVDDMPDTSPEEPTPVEQSVISQAITALNSAVTTTTQKAQEATESADRAEQAAEGVEGYAERAESAQQAAESARDIALEAKVSAQASAATATEKASEASESAGTASQSALTAENASESASASADASYQNAQTAYRYAQDSATSAGQAESYASGASGYASDAQTHSQTASQKASEAAQSASTAVQAKTDAITAKTASETAQGLAESARDGAVTAKTSAESARDEAQDIVDGITDKVEQIDSNTDRIESLEDDRYKPYVTDTASGAVASFSDGADNIPLKSCIVQIEPVQAGSGDPSPDNVRPITGWTGCEVQRTGKNLIPADIEYAGNYSHTNYIIREGIYKTFYFPVPKGMILYHADTTRGAVQCGLIDEPLAVGVQICGGNLPNLTNYNNRLIDNTEGHKYLFVMTATGDDGRTAMERIKEFGISFLHQDYIPGVYTEPKPSATYPITFPTEAGTIYGGYIDPINGELVTCPYYASYNGETLTGEWISDRDKYVAGTTPTIGAQVVNIGAVGERYTLTAIDIKTLLGQNNIWADTGNVSVEYRADTTLYIKRLTDSDTDMVADANIVSGQYFMVGTDLYKATVNIASGASVIVGTNAVKVSLAQALNEINQ